MKRKSSTDTDGKGDVQRVYDDSVPPPTTGKKRKKESIEIDPKNLDEIVSPVSKKTKKNTTIPSSLIHDSSQPSLQLPPPQPPLQQPLLQQQPPQPQPLVVSSPSIQVPQDEVTTTTTATVTATRNSSILQDVSNASTPIEHAFRNMTPSPVTFTKNIVDSNIVHHPSVIHPIKEQNGNNTTTTTTTTTNSRLFFVYSLVWLVLHVMIAIGSDGVLCTPFWKDYQIDSPLHDPPAPKKQPKPQKPRVQVEVVEEIQHVQEIVEEIVDIILPNPQLKNDYFQTYWKQYEAEKQRKDLQLAKQVLSTPSSSLDNTDDIQLQYEVEKERLQVWHNQITHSEVLFQKQDFTLDENVLVLDPTFFHQQQYHPPPPKSTTDKTSNMNISRQDVERLQTQLKNLATSTEIKVIQNKTNIQTYVQKTLQTALLSHPPISNQEENEDEDVDLVEMKAHVIELKQRMKDIKQEIYNHQINDHASITEDIEDKDDSQEEEWNEEKVKDHVQTLLERYDVTGIKDYASLRHGASIISEGSTFATSTSLVDELPALNRLMAKANLRFYGHGPYAALNPTYPIDSLGQCWSILPEKQTIHFYKFNRKRGKYATLAIKLSTPLSSIDSVIVEHPIFASETSHSTAIQSFRVLAFETDDATSTPYQIGTFQYNIGTFLTKSIVAFMILNFVIHTVYMICLILCDFVESEKYLQTFPIVEKQPEMIQSVVLAIDTNWGADYACLYRFRVQGQSLK